MKIRALLVMMICTGLLISVSARADLKYFSDPPHKKLNDEDPPPMAEMVDLANQGDTRAQFILGDMSEKGKGGLEKDAKQARRWFEEAAMHGYNQSFIRLAAMAKHDNNPVEAWQWYTLAINSFDDGDAQQYAIRARKELTDTAKLTSDDTDKARKAIDEWKDARDKQLRAEKDSAAEKERLQKEQGGKDAQAEKDKTEKDAKDKAEQDAKAGAEDNGVAATAAAKDQDKKPDQEENDNEQN